MERSTIEGIDLNDPERFKRMEHHEMFRRLRAEDPVYWQPDDLKGGGYWNVVKHADLIEVNRDTATFSSEVGGPACGVAGGAAPAGLALPHDAVAGGWLVYIGVVPTVGAYWLFYAGLRS